jgi:apolipoprotein N-acyltransferase
MLGLTGAWVLLHVLMIHGFLPGAFLALVPFAVGVASVGCLRGTVGFSLVGGWALFAAAEYFLANFSPGGLALFSLWQGASLVPVSMALRWAHTRWRMPLAFALPIAWVGGEYLRNLGPLAIPTGMPSGPCYDQLWMIQVSDLAGVYGLNFALAMINGFIADAWLARRAGQGKWWTMRAFRVVVAVWVFIAGYGAYRLAETARTVRPGPVIAVVQPDVPYRAGIARGFDPKVYLQEMLARTESALQQQPAPVLAVWPEAMSTMPPINAELMRAGDDVPKWLAPSRDEGLATATALREWSAARGLPLLVGSVAWRQEASEWRLSNAAISFTPNDATNAPFQSKMRLFPGGEHIPFPGTFLHGWLTKLVQLGGVPVDNYTAAQQREIFSSTSDSSRFVVNLCYEVLFADSSGVFLSGADGQKPFQYLLNISNDGVFRRSRGQLVHWRALPFRAVEGRIGIARAANTGISGFVKPTGEMYGEVRNAKGQIWTGEGAPELPLIADVVKRRQAGKEFLSQPGEYSRLTNDIASIIAMRAAAGVSGASTQPVYLDSRRTLYSRTGDVFAGVMLALMLAGALGGVWMEFARPKTNG